MEKEYFLGLDMGTGSLGWAVTNRDYNILRAHGRALWGVRLFETANTAEERRVNRTARRRRDREKWRIRILQELFSEEISKTDPGFFLRMKESKYMPEDKRDTEGNCPELPYALFCDKDYTDKEYHKEFPTIYHLRNMLMKTESMPDIRLVYLAFHHMLKHRGHSLLSGNIESIKNFDTVFDQFLQSVKNEELNFQLDIDEYKYRQIGEILKDNQLTRTDKKKKILAVSGAKSKCEKAILSLLAGSKVKVDDIFDKEEMQELSRTSLCFAESAYDDYAGELEIELGEHFGVIAYAKAVYDWAVLADILGEHVSLSEAKIEIFNKHKKDLAALKKVARTYLSKEDYDQIFVVTDGKTANYPAYIGMTKKNGRKQEIQGHQCAKDEFYKFIKSRLKCDKEGNALEGEKTVAYILGEIEREMFLPKQVNQDNSVLPYQVHLYEWNKILENLEDKSAFIKEIKEKMVQLFSFRVPYYVGPLNVIRDEKNPKFTWAKRKSEEKIYPWNFEEVIDIEESSERFIRRMTNKCTYLYGEDVLPKDSLMYSRFMVLNELNNVRVNGDKLSVEWKQKIYRELFLKNRKVTIKKLKKFLIKEGAVGQECEITGVDGDFKAGLTAYHNFKEKLTGIELSDEQKESIILNIVLFGEDKSLLKNRIKKMFTELSDKQMKAICSMNYSGWGRLSKTFLEEITAPAPETGEVWSILRALWETNDNLMQLLSEKYEFSKAIDEWNQDEKQVELTYKTVEELYVSPAVKRQIWQTLKVVGEIQKVMGCPPKRIFVEMAREKMPSKRTVSRKSQLLELYKTCKKEERQWISEINSHDDNKLRSDKLYLYYTQKGRCMYSGKPIHLEDLWDNNKYDIDHIYPQSKVMDDSLDNRVLVKKEYNEIKSDRYPIVPDIRKNMQPFWKTLLEGKFISKEKYERLNRSTDFSPEELAGFIARQLVETRQSTKATAELLKQAFPQTEIVYAKAVNVSHFRDEFKIFKVRDMNDLHHAKDAYLNIVVGNAFYVKFTKNAVWYVKNHSGRSYNLKKMFTSKYDIERNGEIAWRAGDSGTIKTVRDTMAKNNILVTRKSYEVCGALFDLQIMKKGKGQLPIKLSDERLRNIEHYGGYNKITGAYFMLVESEGKKGKLIRTIVEVPLHLKKKIEEDDCFREKYLIEKEFVNPRVLIKCIKKDTLFKINGFPLLISGRSNKQLIFKGAVQLVLPWEMERVLKKVLKYNARLENDKNLKITAADELDEKSLVMLYDEFIHKMKNTIYKNRPNNQGEKIEEGREDFLLLSMEEKCNVLQEVLRLFQCGNNAADLRLIGGSKSAGIIMMSNNITKADEVSIIYQSPTGIYEQEIDLKKI